MCFVVDILQLSSSPGGVFKGQRCRGVGSRRPQVLGLSSSVFCCEPSKTYLFLTFTLYTRGSKDFSSFQFV